MTIIAEPGTLSDAVRLASMTGGKEWKAYYRGVTLGFVAAMADDDFSDSVRSAEQTWLAQPAPYREAFALLQIVPDDVVHRDKVMRACGVLWGFKRATEDRADAETCSACDRRILTTVDDDIYECPEHGHLHDPDCRQLMCRPVCWDEPDFDEDRYYRNRYGSAS